MKVEKLLDVVQIKNPKPEKFNGEKRYYSTGNIDEYDVSENFELVKFENRPSRANVQPIENSVGFAKMKSTAKTILVTKNYSECIFSTGINFLVPSENIISKYLYYYLISPYFLDLKDKYSGQGIMGGLSNKNLNLFKIPVPSLQEQENIVERMDKLEKRNTELYKIYKEQLLDLKNLSEEYLNKSFSKMNKNLTPLQLSTINITDGSHNPAKGVDKSNYMMLSSKNVIEDELNFENPRYLKKEDFLLENKRTNLEVNDVLLTIVGTIGRTAVVKNLEHNITFQRSVCVIKPNKEILNSYYLKYFLDSIKSFLEKNARGVAQKGIYLNQIREINIPLMDLERQLQLVTETEKVHNLIKEITKKKNEQILKQEQIKKSILNKEFSYE